MASLLGKADPTLVKGAAIYAQANIPGDMSEIYEQREATQKEWMKLGTEVQKAWDAKFKDWDDYTARMEDKFTLVNRNINQGKTNPYKTKETRDAMDRMRNDMKDLDRRGKKGNFEWIELEEELQKLVSTTKDNDAGILELIAHQDNNDLMYFGGGRELGILEGIIDDYNNGTNSMNVKYKNGDYVYTLKGEGTDKDLSMTFSELKEKLLIKDQALLTAAQKQANNYKKYLVSAIDDGVIDQTKETDVRNGYTSMLGTVKARRNLAWARVEGLEYSFYEYVTGVTKDGIKIDNTEFQTEIFEALEALGTDIDGKDGLDTVDTYLDEDNAIALEKEIIEGRKGKVLMADFFVNQITKDVLAQHEAQEVKDGEDVSTTTYTPNQIMINDIVSTSTMSADDMNNKLKFVTGGKVELSGDGTKFNFFRGNQFQGSVSVDDREGVRGALYNLTGTKTEERITPDITVGLPTEEDIKKGEMIKSRQKQYEEEQIELLRTPNRKNTKKKIEQIFNTSEGNKFWGFANNPGNVTKAFTNSTYADMGMKFTHIKKDSGHWTREDQLVHNEQSWMKVNYDGNTKYFNTELSDFQSRFQKWFLSVVDPKDVAKFNRLEE